MRQLKTTTLWKLKSKGYWNECIMLMSSDKDWEWVLDIFKTAISVN